ncbi:MAG: hypothetical protein ACJ0PU_02810 [Flavobacteriaceae bacterium]
MIKKFKNKFVNYTIQRRAIKRPLSIKGRVELKKGDLRLIESNLTPRVLVNEKAYSMSHQIDFNLIPNSVLKIILFNWDQIEMALGSEGVLRSCSVYRNIHVPKKERKKEIFSEAWHRDTIGVTNVQMFILLHNTVLDHGPFRYVNSEDMRKVIKTYPELENPKNRSVSKEINENYVNYFLGSRGDFLLVNTFTNFHSATIPKIGFKRDMVSIAFEPKKLTKWKNNLGEKQIQGMLENLDE